MPNPFAHIELNTDNVAKAKKFYKAVFEWNLRDMPKFKYTIIDVGGGTGGGMQQKPMPEAPTAWLPYVQVDDIHVTLAKAEKAGASVVLDATDIGDMGQIGVFIDPSGATLGVWQSAPAAPELPAKKKVAAKKSAAKKPATKKSPAKTAGAKKSPAKKASKRR